MDIIILGTGGNCIDILDTLLDINDAHGSVRFRPIGFLDDRRELRGHLIHGVEVLGGLERATEFDANCRFINGIGSPANFTRREEIRARTGIGLDRFETIVHPSASVSRMAHLGRGVVVFQNVTITSNVRLGDGVVVLPNTVVSHDDVIGDHTLIAGGVCISGGVSVGTHCYIGTNAAIRGGVGIGERVMVGMGSVVLNDVESGSVVVGNPARVLSQRGNVDRGNESDRE